METAHLATPLACAPQAEQRERADSREHGTVARAAARDAAPAAAFLFGRSRAARAHPGRAAAADAGPAGPRAAPTATAAGTRSAGAHRAAAAPAGARATR